MSFPQVSILIPVYNRKKYIAECIQSALDQSFTDHEIVVVDNASDDGTWEICQQFAVLDPRVRVFRNEENIGPVRNWIRCTQEARGEYSKILFSDDLLEPDCIERMLQPFNSPEMGFVFCAARIGESKGNSTIAYSVKGDSLIDKRKYLSLLLHNRAPVSPGAVLLRTADLIKNLHTDFPTATPRPFASHGAGPDVMIMLLTAMNYSFISNIPNPLVFFRAHSGSFTNKNSDCQVEKGYRSILSYYLKKYHGRNSWMKYLSSCWLDDIKVTKRFASPQRLLIEYQGDGARFDSFLILFYAARQVIAGIILKSQLLGNRA